MKIITSALGILVAAGAVIKKASDILTQFVTKNTPESALLAALLTLYQAYSTGNIPAGAAAIAAFTALMTFAVAESAKDAKTATP
jgi:hypothetical protein